ncbi:hypothetical protein ACFFRR_001334 [Megaselia abdita]
MMQKKSSRQKINSLKIDCFYKKNTNKKVGELNSGLQYVTSSLIVGAVVGLCSLNRSNFSTLLIEFPTNTLTIMQKKKKKDKRKLFPAKFAKINCFRTLGMLKKLNIGFLVDFI